MTAVDLLWPPLGTATVTVKATSSCGAAFAQALAQSIEQENEKNTEADAASSYLFLSLLSGQTSRDKGPLPLVGYFCAFVLVLCSIRDRVFIAFILLLLHSSTRLTHP